MTERPHAPGSSPSIIPCPRGRFLVIGLLLAAVTLAVFWPATRFAFINYDDPEYVTDNPQVLAGMSWAGFKWAFTSTEASNWHPLTWLSHMLDVSLFGPGAAGPHFTNIALHSANTSLLFLLLVGMTGAQWRSVIVAALFALHPLHVESVAWVSERKDVLSAFFGLLALMCYARYARPQIITRKSSIINYSLCLYFFALGLMSKPMLVTLPFVMLLLDYWPLKRLEICNLRSAILRLVVEKLPFLILSAASCVVTLVAQKHAVQPLEHISVSVRVVNAVTAYMRYLGNTVWPSNLAIPYPHVGYGSVVFFCLSVLVLLSIASIVIRYGRKFPFVVTGWLWYFGMLVPVIGLVQVGMQAMADRYTYLPVVGVFIVGAWAAHEAAVRWRLPVPVLFAVASLVLAGCIVTTRKQLSHWQNSETLFLHSIAVTRDNDIAYYNLGTHYYSVGRVNDAIVHFRNAIEIKPSYDDAQNNLASALATNGDLDEAAVLFREALRVQPEDAELHYNLGNVLAMQKRFDEAISEYTQSLRIKSDDARVHNNLGNVLLIQGQRDMAVLHFQEAIRINPNHEGARRQLGTLGVLPPD